MIDLAMIKVGIIEKIGFRVYPETYENMIKYMYYVFGNVIDDNWRIYEMTLVSILMYFVKN